MGHQTTGNSAAYPVSFLVPDDGDPKTAASYNVGLQALADRTAYLAKRAPNTIVTFSASGTWIAPAGCTAVIVDAWGGGGGGGACSVSPGTVTVDSQCGGGGGGGSIREVRVVPVVPGTSYTVTIGAGGAEGFSGVATSFGSESWYGGSPGGTEAASASGTAARMTSGGAPGPSSNSRYNRSFPVATGAEVYPFLAGHGGSGTNAAISVAGDGAGSANYNGGLGGSAGTAAGSYQGGGGGGGGGAGHGGDGGAGGVGAAGSAAGARASGNGGGNASANSGAGGGGVGGGGQAPGGAPATQAHGGTGGSGKLTVIYASTLVP